MDSLRGLNPEAPKIRPLSMTMEMMYSYPSPSNAWPRELMMKLYTRNASDLLELGTRPPLFNLYHLQPIVKWRLGRLFMLHYRVCDKS